MQEISEIQRARYSYQPKLPAILKDGLKGIEIVEVGESSSISDEQALQEIFSETFAQPFLKINKSDNSNSSSKKLKVGVVLSGGPAAGGHNVIIGLFDALKQLNSENELIGFRQGPGGIVKGEYLDLTAEVVEPYRNTGGFDMIQSGRTKIETPEQFKACLTNCINLKLNALLVIGGDDSNTNAAMLAQYFKSEGSSVQVVGAPKTIDGDLKNEYIESSFGFDTACKTYAELTGNICRDAISSAKYWHFIKLMGRSASHITLEVGLQTQINSTLIGEEIEAQNKTLHDIVDELSEMIAARAKKGKNYGVILIPEGIIEFIPEMGVLISALNEMLSDVDSNLNSNELIELAKKNLKGSLLELFISLPNNIQSQLVAERDPHGNVQVSLIETEKLLAELVTIAMEKKKKAGEYNDKFGSITHFFGYEGRCATPSNFDTDYCYSLGQVSGALIQAGKTGYIACLKDLNLTSEDWKPMGIPLTSMMNLERRHGKDKPVIKKALVELDGEPLKFYNANKAKWKIEDAYIYPGPIQYFGPPEIADKKAISLTLEKTK